MFGALYLRISRDKGENEDTLQNHREAMDSFCKKNGYSYEVYEEIVSGGTHEIEKRPQLEELISKIEKYECILVVSLDRISRNGLVSQTIKQVCMDYDIKIITPSQSFDLANKQEDRILYDVSSMFATMEYEMIAKRNKLNKVQRARRGEWVSASPPFGYRRDKAAKRLVIHEEEAKVIRYIFKLHSRGMGSTKIRETLNNEGYKPARSDYFNNPSIKRIIRNRAYRGDIVYNDRKKIKKDGRYVYENAETVIVENAHPPIISPKEWDEANRERISRANKSAIIREKPAIKSGTTMFKDLIFCGMCGRKMIIRKDSKSSTGYTVKRCEYLLSNGQKCNNSGVRLETIEKNFYERELISFKNQLDKLLRELELSDTTSLREEQESKLKQIEKQILEVTKQKKDLIKLVLNGTFTETEAKETKLEIEDRLIWLNTEKEKINTELESPDVEDVSEKIKDILYKIEVLPNMDEEKANETLKTFVKKIHYKRQLPKELLKKSTQNPERRNYPCEIRVEYY